MSPLATWVTRNRQRLGLNTHALGQRSGVSHRVLYYLESSHRRGVSARALLQLATFFHQQDQTIDVSLPTLLSLMQPLPRGRHAPAARPPRRLAERAA